jgi:hypothetical protein
MTDPVLSPRVPDLAERLARLERAHRRTKLVAIAASLGCFAWTACSLVQTKNTVSAERFVLLGSDGSERATLELDSKGNPLLLMRNGSASAILTTNGPSLLLRGPDGKTGAFVGIDSKNTSRVELSSSRLLDGVRLTTHEDGSCGVYVLDSDGRERGAFESLASGNTSLSFHDANGRLRGQVGLDANKVPNLILLDEEGARRIGMVVQENAGILELEDEKGRTRAQLTTLFDGSPQLEFKRDDGTSSYRAP